MTTGRAARCAASATRCSRRYACPRCRPSNTPTTTNTGSSERREVVQAAGDVHVQPGSTTGGASVAVSVARRTGRPDSAGRSASTLCGCRAPATARQTAAIAPVRTNGEHQRGVPDRERRLGGGDQALAQPPDLVRGDDRVRQVLEARVDRQQDPLDPGRPIGGVLPKPVEGDRVLETERARRGTNQRAEVRAALETRAEIARKGPDVGPGRARDVDDRHRPGRVRAVPLEQRRLVDDDVARRELHDLAARAPSGTRGVPRSARRCRPAAPGAAAR